MDVVHKTCEQPMSPWKAHLCVAVLLGVLAGGCGGTLYAVDAGSASAKLESARALGAERLAPYEYWMAHENLQKAREEAASADYGDALNFVSTAEEYADKAIKLSRQAHEGSGR